MGLKNMNEFQLRDFLKEKRERIKNFDDLVNYLRFIEEECNIGYGHAPRAVAQAALAVAKYLTYRFGLSGFQAGFVMWDFILGYEKTDNEAGLRLIDYDDMLYPQYQYKFEKTISAKTYSKLKDIAAKNIREADEVNGVVSPDVYEHWKKIANGEVPFGYSIRD